MVERRHTTERTIEQIPIGPGVHAVRWTDSHTTATAHHGQEHSTTSVEVRERVLTDAQIDTLLAGDLPNRAPYHILLPKESLDLVGRFVYQDFETLRQHGTLDVKGRGPERYAHRDLSSAHHRLAMEQLRQASEAPFSFVANAQGADTFVVLENRLSHGAYATLDGRMVPSLFQGDYMNGLFHNGAYRLDMAAAHLIAHPDVEVIAVPKGWNDGGASLADTPEEAVHLIPGYNAEEHTTESLVFLWCPTGDARQRIVDWFQHDPKASKLSFWAFVFDEDLLGLRAAGSALFQGPYDTVD